jgi:hypothetical protein
MKAALLVVVALATLLSTSRPAVAQDVVAGWQGDNVRGYAFVAPTAGFDMTSSQFVLLRATASFLYYNSQSDGPTDVMAPGGAVAVGYRISAPRVSLTMFGGFERRRIHHGWEQGASASGEMFFSATRLTQLSALGSFAEANRYTWVRAGAKRQLTNTNFSGSRALSVGAEVTAEGNRDVTSYEFGGLFEHAWLRAGMSMQFRAGYSRSAFQTGPDQQKPYFGIGIYRRL